MLKVRRTKKKKNGTNEFNSVNEFLYERKSYGKYFVGKGMFVCLRFCVREDTLT